MREQNETRRILGTEPDPRFTFANERTFLAWMRTALALIGGGLAAGQLIEFESEAARLATAMSPLVLAACLPAISFRRWQRNELAMRRGEPLPVSSLPRTLAIGTVLIAIVVGAVVAAGQVA